MTDVLIPIKSLQRAKQRLAGVLSADERAGLVLAMLRDLLGALGTWETGNVWIISADDAVIATGRAFGAQAIREARSHGYNEAVLVGLESLPLDTSVVVLPGDLPCAIGAELKQLATAQPSTDAQIHVVPDRDRMGTNGLYLSSPRLIKPAFGPHSFDAHKQAARAAGAKLSPMRLTGLGKDIDTPDDLSEFAASGATGETSQYLSDIGFAPDRDIGRQRSVA